MLSSIRSLVEQTQKRLKDFQVIKNESLWRGHKYEKGAEFLSQVVGVLGSLVNFKLEKHPIRRNPKRRKADSKEEESSSENEE
jgi:hypothetical protein